MSERHLRAALVAVLLSAVAVAPVMGAATPTGPARPTVETEPVLSESDAADDVAIWAHPDDPGASLVIGTDKRAGAVEVYDMAGRRRQLIADGRANGVDLRRGVRLGGEVVDLVVVGGGSKARFYRVDVASRTLVRLELGDDESTVTPNGVCLYRSPASGRLYLFGISLSSVVEQVEIFDDGGRVGLGAVRGPFDVGSDAEACVADDDLGHLYVNEADHHLWKYAAEPDGGDTRRSVDQVGGDGHLTADVEGLTLVRSGGDGDGYLLASSQGDDSFAVYRRDGDNAFVRSFTVVSGEDADGCANTDGIDALAADLGSGFRHGVFVCQDHTNTSPAAGNQNFKYVPLERVVDLDGPGPTPSTSTSTSTASSTATTGAPTTTTTAAAPRPSSTTTVPAPTTSTTAAAETTTTTAVPVTTTTVPSSSTTAPTGSSPSTTVPSSSMTATSRTTIPPPSPTTTRPRPPDPPVAPSGAPARSGYWMAGADGRVYAFGAAAHSGDAARRLALGVEAVDLEPDPAGTGYWVLDRSGTVHAFGTARQHGGLARAALRAGEVPTSLSATPSGRGYWIFTDLGRVVAFGDAPHLGDLAAVQLNGPVLDSIPTPTGRGYYIVASDGGIFTFGDARFHGSMGGTRLNAPVRSLVPDGDGAGYWLVASDGGVFAFAAPFRGSLGGVRLNRPVTGMVPYGNGYLMVGSDGGVFNFSDRAFAGSLGANPPERPIVSVAALR